MEEFPVGDGIERLVEIQYCNVYLGSGVEGREHVIHVGEELCAKNLL